MTEELNNLLQEAYHSWKNHPNPPIPLETIRDYLALEGLQVDEYLPDKGD